MKKTTIRAEDMAELAKSVWEKKQPLVLKIVLWKIKMVSKGGGRKLLWTECPFTNWTVKELEDRGFKIDKVREMWGTIINIEW